MVAFRLRARKAVLIVRNPGPVADLWRTHNLASRLVCGVIRKAGPRVFARNARSGFTFRSAGSACFGSMLAGIANVRLRAGEVTGQFKDRVSQTA